MFPGRLGLEGGRIPQKERHGVIWLGRGRLMVESATLKFLTAGNEHLDAGAYPIPYQGLSCIVIEPGMVVSHDALRIMARHGTGLVASGTAGTRFYASMPAGPDDSKRARRHATLWADEAKRRFIARRMYALRLGELFPDADLNTLRGMEGARVRATYKALAKLHGIQWRGRKYDRQNPDDSDPPNQAINHVAVALRAAAQVAVAVSGAIPQLGFIHEDSGMSFPLDIADLFRDDVVVPTAFQAVRQRKRHEKLETVARHLTAKVLREKKLVAKMSDHIKDLLDASDDDHHP